MKAELRVLPSGFKTMALLRGLAVALLLLPAMASAAPKPGTVAYDYRNAPPTWQALTDYEVVVLSHRAIAAADSLRARGVKVYLWLQPFLPYWQGAPVTAWPVDAAMWQATQAAGAVLPCTDLGMSDNRVCDFRVPGYGQSLAIGVSAALPPADGIMMDYGCESVAWIAGCQGLGIDWTLWGSGYYLYRQGLKASAPGRPMVAACNTLGGWIPQVTDGLLLEGVGYPQNLTSPTKAWGLIQARPESQLLCQSPVPQHRRLLATMALVAGCRFNWRPGFFQGKPWENTRDPEHFEFSLGTRGSSIIVLAPGVYLRPFSRGWALVNLAGQTYSYQNYPVAPQDGLVVQTRDSLGRYIARRSNVGR